jgi:hypothetical protein
MILLNPATIRHRDHQVTRGGRVIEASKYAVGDDRKKRLSLGSVILNSQK